MAYLLDTHTFIWFAEDSPRLSSPARTVLVAHAEPKLVSIATVWEAAIKIKTGSLKLSFSFDDLISRGIEGCGFQLLDLRRAHVRKVLDLPLHHRDPFDRILAAQALFENLTILSCDAALDAYGVARLW